MKETSYDKDILFLDICPRLAMTLTEEVPMKTEDERQQGAGRREEASTSGRRRRSTTTRRKRCRRQRSHCGSARTAHPR
jgi:hypothetical protein